MLTIEIIR